MVKNLVIMKRILKIRLDFEVHGMNFVQQKMWETGIRDFSSIRDLLCESTTTTHGLKSLGI